MAAPVPDNEAARLRTLADYQILDTPRESTFDDLTRLAAHICGTPISLVTLVDSDRQWFKSSVGLDLDETPRDVSFCAHAVHDGQLLEVEDALLDARFADNELVTGDPNIRFYAGAPLVTSEGHTLGTLCVIDREPRRLTQEQAAALAALARAAMAHLDLRRQNEHLRALDRLKEEFVGVVSHELRTPLASVVGYVEELLDESAGSLNETQRTFLGIVDRNAERLLTIVNDLLFVTQVEAGSAHLERAPVDLGEVAAEAVESIRRSAHQKSVAVELAAEPAVVAADRRRLGQVLDNLLSNAVKFTEPGGCITVRVAHAAHEAVLEVADTGQGIDPDELPNLFGRFYRTSAAVNGAVPGTGLGLSTTRAIVEAHGGVIGVESEPGRGTTFRVSLPV